MSRNDADPAGTVQATWTRIRAAGMPAGWPVEATAAEALSWAVDRLQGRIPGLSVGEWRNLAAGERLPLVLEAGPGFHAWARAARDQAVVDWLALGQSAAPDGGWPGGSSTAQAWDYATRLRNATLPGLIDPIPRSLFRGAIVVTCTWLNALELAWVLDRMPDATVSFDGGVRVARPVAREETP